MQHLKKLAILHIKDTLEVGGISAFLHTLIKEFQSLAPEYAHTVGCFQQGPFTKKIEALGVPVHLFTPNTYPSYSPQSYKSMLRFVEEMQPSVIHALGFHSITYARFIHHATKIPIVCGIHGNLNTIGILQSKIQALLFKCFGSWASAYTAVSSQTLAVLQTKLPRSFPAKHLHLIHNGIEQDAFNTSAHENKVHRSMYGILEKAFVIGSVGRLAKDKAYHILLEATAQLIIWQRKNSTIAPIHLCLVGEGPERRSLESLAHSLGIESQVHFLGQHIPSAPFYTLFDCFALSSPSEGLSIALLEALTLGLPIVTTHPESTHDVITHGINGLLAPINNPSALAQELKKIILDTSLRNNMSQANKEKSSAFTAHTMTTEYLDLFNAVIQGSL